LTFAARQAPQRIRPRGDLMACAGALLTPGGAIFFCAMSVDGQDAHGVASWGGHLRCPTHGNGLTVYPPVGHSICGNHRRRVQTRGRRGESCPTEPLAAQKGSSYVADRSSVPRCAGRRKRRPRVPDLAGAKVTSRPTSVTNEQLADWIREASGLPPKRNERHEGLEQTPAEQQQDVQDTPHPQENEGAE
jgi:hypothetical protein